MYQIILLTLFLTSVATAEIPAEVRKEIDLRVKHGINPSIVLAVYENGNTTFYTQGLQDLAKNIPANEHSVYEIGSISKTYTALLLAQKTQDQSLQADDAIQDHWPEPFQLVDSNQHAITFKQLATHTSGLPRLPANMSLFSSDPYAEYDRKQLLNGVAQANPTAADASYAYSNFGAGLLSETMAMISNRSYNELVTSEILAPLGLTETYMQLQDVPPAQLAQGYMGTKPTNAWQFKALAGAGSIRSSISDLLAYGVAHLNHPEGALKEAMDLATTTHYQQDQLSVGLGWHISSSGLIWHNGGTGGFSSILVIDRQNQKVAAGLTNGNNSVEDIVFHMMNPKAKMKDYEFAVDIDPEQLQTYTGRFIQRDGKQNVEVEQRGNKLFLIVPKQPKYAMTYIGDDTFKLNLVKVKLKFAYNDQKRINQFELDGWGQPQIYEKAKPHDD